METGPDGHSPFCANGSRERALVDGWIANALRLQRELQADLPLNRLAVLGAHNAFNNRSDGYAVPNQEYSITDQLKMGIRKISLDVHWYNNALRLCHGNSDVWPHVGCSPLDRPFYQGIEELSQWMHRPENGQEVVFLDLELYLDGHEDELIAPIERHLEGANAWTWPTPTPKTAPGCSSGTTTAAPTSGGSRCRSSTPVAAGTCA